MLGVGAVQREIPLLRALTRTDTGATAGIGGAIGGALIGAGAGAYAIGAGTQGESFNPFKMVLEGLGQIGSGLLSFFTSGMQVGFNIWKVGNGAKNSLSSIVGRSIGKLASNFIPNYVLENLF